MKLDEINGFYNPSFFNIVLETDENVLDAIDKHSATFTHEFIHYLQDIILPYNIRMNLSRLRWFFNIRQSAMKKGFIKVPFSEWDNESKTIILQYNMSIGGCKSPRFINYVEKIENVTPTFEKASGFDGAYSMRHREFNVYTYNMNVNNRISYNLGARDLLEYIAYKIESKHFIFNGMMPQLPYESVDLLFEHYGLSHVSDNIRLCIAEVCLYNDNPIRFLFVTFLENQKFKQEIVNLSYGQVYNILLSFEFKSADGVSETITHKTNRRLKQLEDDLSWHYTNFAGIKKWIKKVNDFAKAELSNRFIFSDMYEMDTNKFEETLSYIIGNVGLPLVMNNKEECISLQPHQDNADEFIQFYILQSFFNYVLGGTKRTGICPIYKFCKANGNICNDQCNNNLQLEQLENKECPYFKFLKSYDLINIQLK